MPNDASGMRARTGTAQERGGRRTTGANAPAAAPAKRAFDIRVTAKNTTGEDRRFLDKHKAALSRTTLRAKWLHDRSEHADRDGQSLATRSHEVIRQWAEEREAAPATVPGTERDGRPGVLRFQFDGQATGNTRLQGVDWDAWFRTFDERQLVFVFQERLKNGNQSNFFRLDSPEREDA